MNVKIVKVKPDAIVPEYQSDEAAGADLHACLDQAIVIAPGDRAVVPTGISISMPKGYEAQVRSRSGLAVKYGIACLNSPGTIDSDYRGEIGVILINHGKLEFEVEHGDRIAQIIFARHEKARFKEVDSLEISNRGTGKFGSTGV